MSNTKKMTGKTLLLVETAMLVAIIIVMAFTHLGYISIGPLSLTLLMVPVIIGGVNCGKAVGAFLGAVFGATSFAQCFMGDILGSALISFSIPKTFIVCVVSRTLAGFLCGLIFEVCAKHDSKKGWSYIVASISGSLLNTVLFLGSLVLLFWNTQFTAEQSAALGVESVLKTAVAIASGINAPIELVVCAVIASAVSKALAVALKRISK